jgi:hypothetical protein
LRPASIVFVITALWAAVWTTVFAAAPQAAGRERRAYEGVVSWKQATIGTVITLNIHDNQVSGWLLQKKPVPVDGGSVIPDGVEFQAAGNTYRIDERRDHIIYSGPDGDGDRYLATLTQWTGRLVELVEATETLPEVAVVEVRGRRRELRYDAPMLWKNNGPPFEKFDRLKELLGKQISVWVADADARGGRLVVIEEPQDMDIPLKAPKNDKSKEKK